MTITLPGLRADDPLGFLAAMGLAALSEHGLLPPLRLGWEGGAAPVAVIDGDVTALADLEDHLDAALQNLEERGEALPGTGEGFPIRKQGVSGSDPMRMTPHALADWYAHAAREEAAGNPWFGRWLIALAGQATVKKGGDVELTPFYAPTGQMSLRVSILDKTIHAVHEVAGPADTLTAWRRTSYDGANFDDRAKRDAGVTTNGKPDNQGAPSPTWLAAQGIRLFPMTDDGGRVRTVGWQRVRIYRGFTSRSLVWPAWAPLLDPSAVRTLIAHPALQLRVIDGEATLPPRNAAVLNALGVTAVFGSSRRTLQQGDGPLGPARLVWSQAL